jgi:predicted metalloprotease with PDZ domain
MSAPRHLWSGEWESESESAAEEVDRRRGLRRRAEAAPEAAPEDVPAQPARQRRSLRHDAARAIAAMLAAWRSPAARAARWPAAAQSRLAGISPRQVGLTLLATVAGAAVALGAAALAGGSDSSNAGTGATTSGPPAAWLGVQTTTSTAVPGALIELIEPGGPAERAGLMPGDVITEVDGRPITTSGDLARTLAAKQPGEQVQLQVNRFGQTIVIDATLGSRRPGVP